MRKLVEDGELAARSMIREHVDQFETIAQALLEFETLTGDELRGLMDGKQPVRDIDNDNTPKSTGVPKAGKAHKKRGGEPDAGLEPQPGT